MSHTLYFRSGRTFLQAIHVKRPFYLLEHGVWWLLNACHSCAPTQHVPHASLRRLRRFLKQILCLGFEDVFRLSKKSEARTGAVRQIIKCTE